MNELSNGFYLILKDVSWRQVIIVESRIEEGFEEEEEEKGERINWI